MRRAHWVVETRNGTEESCQTTRWIDEKVRDGWTQRIVPPGPEWEIGSAEKTKFKLREIDLGQDGPCELIESAQFTPRNHKRMQKLADQISKAKREMASIIEDEIKEK